MSTPTPMGKLFVLCNPLLDLTLEVDEAFLQAHKLVPDTSCVYFEKFEGLFEDMTRSDKLRRSPGGAGLNTARVAQWLLTAESSTAGGSVTYVGCVGDDANGKLIKQLAEQEGVQMALEVTTTEATGLCAVCKCGASRTLVASLAAARRLAVDHLRTPPVATALKEANIVYTTAYAATFHVEHTKLLAAGTRASPSHQLFAMGLSSKYILEIFGEDIVDVLSRLDIIICNREEIADLAMMLQWLPDGMTEAQLALKVAQEMMYDRHDVRRVIVTRGGNSTVYATSEGEVGEVPTAALAAGASKDKATGAGDAFVGGFLAAMVNSKRDIKRCCAAGNEAAAYMINNSIKSLPTADAPQM